MNPLDILDKLKEDEILQQKVEIMTRTANDVGVKATEVLMKIIDHAPARTLVSGNGFMKLDKLKLLQECNISEFAYHFFIKKLVDAGYLEKLYDTTYKLIFYKINWEKLK